MIQQIEDDTGTLPPSLPRGVAPEVAASNPDVEAIIQPRITMLMEIANSFLTTIIDSLETVPYGIRWICKQIRSLTKVSCSGLGYARARLTDSESTQKHRTRQYARSSAASSSCVSSTPRSSPRRRICWWTACQPSIRVGR